MPLLVHFLNPGPFNIINNDNNNIINNNIIISFIIIVIMINIRWTIHWRTAGPRSPSRAAPAKYIYIYIYTYIHIYIYIHTYTYITRTLPSTLSGWPPGRAHRGHLRTSLYLCICFYAVICNLCLLWKRDVLNLSEIKCVMVEVMIIICIKRLCIIIVR